MQRLIRILQNHREVSLVLIARIAFAPIIRIRWYDVIAPSGIRIDLLY